LQVAVEGPSYVSATHGQVNVIDGSAILNAGVEDGMLHVFMVNRSLDETATVQVELADGAIAALESGELLCGTDPKAVNTFEQPDLVRPQALEDMRVADGKAEVELPPLSVAAMTYLLR
jgi:alpha-N-arabinofuranosidase